jgi:ABC-type taurine transport system substrate-binding protein
MSINDLPEMAATFSRTVTETFADYDTKGDVLVRDTKKLNDLLRTRDQAAGLLRSATGRTMSDADQYRAFRQYRDAEYAVAQKKVHIANTIARQNVLYKLAILLAHREGSA